MSQIEVFNFDQNTPEWHRARMGIPTASAFDAIMTPGKTKTEQKTRRTYLLKLAGEIITGNPMEQVVTRDMERGHALEPEARDLYRLQAEADLDRVGFIRRDGVGCSPDSLIGEDGGLEIKTKAPHLLIDATLKDEFPEEHKAQVQGALWITGRKWWDIAVYWPGLPLFVKRATRDEAYIANLASEVQRFRTDLNEVVSQMQAKVLASLPDWIALKDLTPSPELLASRIVQEARYSDGIPEFLKRAKPGMAEVFEGYVDMASAGHQKIARLNPFDKRTPEAGSLSGT